MNRTQLLASLEVSNQAQDQDGMYLEDGRYADWSSRERSTGEYRVELGDDDEAVQILMTREELVRLHAALTRTLLRDAE